MNSNKTPKTPKKGEINSKVWKKYYLRMADYYLSISNVLEECHPTIVKDLTEKIESLKAAVHQIDNKTHCNIIGGWWK